MFIQIFSSIAFIVPEKSVTNFFKNGKIWKPITGHKYKSYGLLVNILPLHLPYLRYQVWYKFHRSRTANINVIEQNVFFKPIKGHNSKCYEPLAPIPVSLSMFIQISSYLAFIVPENLLRQILGMAKFENLSKNISPRVMSPWPPFFHYTFLTLETKCDVSFIEVGPQALKLLSRTHFNFVENLPRDITPRVINPWPLFRYDNTSSHCKCLYELSAFWLS